ncbi:hypothetical protein GGI43DRAFT_246135 [Trichoderma evansii]
MQTFFLVVLGLLAGSPLVRADMNGGYLKSMFSGRQPVTTSSELMDSRFFSLWSSFHKLYLEHLATATMSSPVATAVPNATTTNDLNEPVFTIDKTRTYSTSGPAETTSLYTTVTQSVSSCSSACPSVTAPPVLPETTSSAPETGAVQPSKNGTMVASTRSEESTTSSTSSKGSLRPSKTPPPLNGPLNGVSTNAAPVVGAVVLAIAGGLVVL